MKSKEILSAFEKEVKQNKISASYLFYGDKRVGLLFYALEFSKIVNFLTDSQLFITFTFQMKLYSSGFYC